MLKSARNTLTSIEESANRTSTAVGALSDDLRPVLSAMAIDVHRTCQEVRDAARAHERAADRVSEMIEALLWGVVLGVAVYYARELFRAVGDLAHE